MNDLPYIGGRLFNKKIYFITKSYTYVIENRFQMKISYVISSEGGVFKYF